MSIVNKKSKKPKVMHSILKFIALLLILCCSAEGYKDYKGYKIYDITPESDSDQRLLQQLSRNAAYDFFNLERRLNTSSRVLVSPEANDKLLSILRDHGVRYTLRVADVAVPLAADRQRNTESPLTYPLARSNLYERYYRHYEINEHMDALASKYPSRVFVKTFGRSYEGRPLKLMTITNGDGRSNKKIILIDAAVHAREWITPPMALLIMDELTENYEANVDLLQDYDWVIMPIVNADGYEYTHEVDRYWRKTRRPTANHAECIGADANRNFDFVWGDEEGASNDPCMETFHGDYAFSEAESQVLRDIMWHYNNRTKMYLSLHSYGSMILLPWGHKSELIDNFDEQMDVAQAGALAILFSTNNIYSYGSTYHVIYATSGDSADYAAGVMGIPVTIAMEMPAGGFSGFDPPVRQIEDIINETWTGIKAMAEKVIEMY